MRSRLVGLLVRVVVDLTAIALLLAVAGLIWVAYYFYGPPLVTIANATGEDLRGVILDVASACPRAFRFDLPKGSRIEMRVAVCGKGSTFVEWADPSGTMHRQNGRDYLEGYRGYRSFVVILPNGRVDQLFRRIGPEFAAPIVNRADPR